MPVTVLIVHLLGSKQKGTAAVSAAGGPGRGASASPIKADFPGADCCRGTAPYTCRCPKVNVLRINMRDTEASMKDSQFLKQQEEYK